LTLVVEDVVEFGLNKGEEVVQESEYLWLVEEIHGVS
jgi:hypothetical protein